MDALALNFLLPSPLTGLGEAVSESGMLLLMGSGANRSALSGDHPKRAAAASHFP